MDLNSSCSHDFLDNNLPLDESILEAMSGPNRPWDDMHHRSYFLPELVRIEHDEFRSTLSEMVNHVVVLFDTNGIYVEGNIANISHTVVIDISQTPGKIENLYINVDCSPEEIQIYQSLQGILRCIFLVIQRDARDRPQHFSTLN
jgi:hypothetical protein